MSASSGPIELDLEAFRGVDTFAKESQLPAGFLKNGFFSAVSNALVHLLVPRPRKDRCLIEWRPVLAVRAQGASVPLG